VAARLEGFVGQRGGRGGQRRRGDVEARPDRFQPGQQRGLRDAVADAQPRQAIGLGERARHQQVGEALHPADGVVALRRREVLGVRLVEQHRDVRRHALQERQHVGAGEEGAGRVVGVGDEHQPRRRREGLGHRRQVMAEVAGRHHGVRRVRQPRGLAVHQEAVLRRHDALARLHQRLRGHGEDLARAAAQDDGAGRHAQPGRQAALSWAPVASG
jgi:hypothetical protein